MKNIIKLLGIIALVAVIGFSFAACGDDGGVLPAPNMTGWYNASNGKIELSWNEIDGAVGYYVYMGLTGADCDRYPGDYVTTNYGSAEVLQAGYIVYFKVAAVDSNGNIGKKSNLYPVSTGNSVNTSLNGVWEYNTWVMTISGSSATQNSWNPTTDALSIDAKNKGYFPNGGQVFRNIVSTGNLTWSGQTKVISYNSSSPNVATGTNWVDCSIAMSADGQTLTISFYTSGGGFGTETYRRR